MSTAPRPHTSPLTSSPPKGSRVQVLGFTGTTSVWPMRHSVGAFGIAALDAGHEARAARGVRGLVDLEVEAAALEIAAQRVAVARLLAGEQRAVVHALVADHLLQQLHRLAGQGIAHGSVS